MQIGNNIKYLRKAVGLSQQQLADKLKLERSTIAKYETNVSEPNLETLCRLADILDASTDEILGRR